eukprot:765143-Hanusia_phi.AAC.1
MKRQESDRVLVDAIRLRRKSSKNVIYGKRPQSATALLDRGESVSSLSSLSVSDRNPAVSRSSSFLVVDELAQNNSESLGVDYIHFYLSSSPDFNLFCVLFDDKLRPLEVVSHQRKRSSSSKIVYRSRTAKVPPRICMNVEAIAPSVRHVVFFIKSNVAPRQLEEGQEQRVEMCVMKSDLQEMICTYDVNMAAEAKSGERAVGDAVVCTLHRNHKSCWELMGILRSVRKSEFRTHALIETVT